MFVQKVNAMDCNVYVGDLRAVKVARKWRVTKRNDKVTSCEWLFLDEVEYDSATEALQKYID